MIRFFLKQILAMTLTVSTMAAIPPVPKTDVKGSTSKMVEPKAPTAASTAVVAPALVDAPRAELDQLKSRLMNKAKVAQAHKATLIFDLPVTYNRRVAHWLQYYQTNGKGWFRDWLERSSKFMPFIQKELRNAGLPADLGYMVMIESGFDPFARSHANAVGPWQFIKPTAERYGLKVNWWIDERRDFKKSTLTAIKYIKDLYQEFGSWYLVAASYNMGETGLRRRIQKYNTKDFWSLSASGALPQETIDYVPKILAAMIIAKAPSLYGFLNISRMDAFEYDIAYLGGGTDLNQLADHLGVTRKSLRDLNAELILGYIPLQVEKHAVRIPNGAQQKVLEFVQGPKSAKN